VNFMSPEEFLEMSEAERFAYLKKMPREGQQAYITRCAEYAKAFRAQVLRDLAALNSARNPGEPKCTLPASVQ
jgi:hypothetical protein